ncbi:hypothetical protein G7054_g5147 [Neopestalotiopsis clavispora]|nr:hypothetical protein G7054_g5147 [Neopestalotiopsis clavispora]
MTHQAHNIPWLIFSSHFQYRFADPKFNGVTNLYPCYKSNQGRELNYFAKAFARAVEEHAVSERRKYCGFVPADPEELILSDEVVERIGPTVHRFRRKYSDRNEIRHVNHTYTPELCRHDVTEKCGCAITMEERKMKAFLYQWQENPCYQFWSHNAEAFMGLEVVKTLLLYGEMDALLRICSHPDVDYKDRWEQGECYDTHSILGWELICRNALNAYLCLNTLYCFPKLWDPESGRIEDRDYRRTRCYQQVLRQCTLESRFANISSFPHRQFFGIADDQFGHNHFHVDGVLPIGKFLELDATAEYQPRPSDLAEVRLALLKKGLPTELALTIMEFARYRPTRRLEIPNDPLHPLNQGELAKYLKYCWQLMIRCDLMAKALGSRIDWEKLVMAQVVDLWYPGGGSHNMVEKDVCCEAGDALNRNDSLYIKFI